MTLNLYTFDWKDDHSEWNYRLEVFEAGMTVVDTWNVVQMNPAAIRELSLSVEKDKKRVGFHNAPELAITWWMQEVLIDTTFQEMIMNANKECYATSLLNTFYASAVYRLKIQFNGNDDNEPVPYRTVFEGIQKVGVAAGFDQKALEFKCSIVDVMRTALDFTAMENLCTYPDHQPFNVYDLVTGWSEPTSVWNPITEVYDTVYVEHAKVISHITGSGDYFKMRSLASLKLRLNYLLDYGYNMLMRTGDLPDLSDTSFEFAVDLPWFTAKKQTYDSSGDAGDEIDSHYLYYISHTSSLDDNTVFHTGIFGTDNSSNPNGDAKGSISDFLNAFAIESDFSLYIYPGVGIKATPGMGYDDSYSIDAELCSEYAPQPFADTALSVKTNLWDKISGEGAQERTVKAANMTKNGNEYQFNNIFDSRPSEVAFVSKTTFAGIAVECIGWLASAPHYGNLYYLEVPTMNSIALSESGGIFIKIHEQPSIIGNAGARAISGYPINRVPYGDAPLEYGRDISRDTKSKVLTEMYLARFSGNSMILELTANLQNGAGFVGGGGGGGFRFWLDGFALRFHIAPPTWHTSFYGEYFYLIKTEINIKKGTAKMTFAGFGETS